MIIALSGLTCTGKSTLAKELERSFAGRQASFSQFIKLLAAKKGENSPDRSFLQKIGEAEVQRDPKEFVREFLEFADWSHNSILIIDGLRHKLIYHELKEAASMANREFKHIHLETPFDIRSKRAALRDISDRDLKLIDEHVSEFDVKAALRACADLILDTSQSVDALVAIVKHFLAQTRVDGSRIKAAFEL